MDDQDRELEALLRRTAHQPAAGPDPRAIVRRARHRTVALRSLGVVAALAIALGAGAAFTTLAPTEDADVVFEGSPATETPSPTQSASLRPTDAATPTPTGAAASPTPTAGAPASPGPTAVETGPAEPPAPPERWVGVRVAGDALEVVLHDGGDERALASHPRTSAEAPDDQATDVVLDDDGGTVLVGLCCEPVSGSFFVAELGGDGGGLEPAPIQGFRADLQAGSTLFARTDTYGILGIQPGFPTVDDQAIRDGASAADVGVEPGPGSRVAALVDPELASMPGTEGGDRGVLVLDRADDGTWHEEAFVPLGARACALAFLADGRVGLLRADAGSGGQAGALDCTGPSVDVLDVGTGTIEEAAVTFPEPVSHLGADGSGRYLIATGGSGQVHWATLDGDAGVLGDGGYVAADW